MALVVAPIEGASALQIDLARRILERIQYQAPGTRVSAPELVRVLGVSRTPISSALALLVGQGVLERTPMGHLQVNRGLSEIDLDVLLPYSQTEELYHKMMQELVRGELPQEVSEAELILRYHVPRGVIRKLLLRLAAEGLVRRLPGHGWRFVDMLVDDKVFHESVEFRIVIECAALRSPRFQWGVTRFLTTRTVHERILQGHATTISGNAWFRVNAAFHEDLTACSGNRFLVDALRKQINLRRVQMSVGPKELSVQRIEQFCREHLSILDAVEGGKFEWGEALLREHLHRATLLG